MSGLGDRITAVSNRFYLRIRHREAFDAAGREGTASDLDAFAGRKYALLTTFKRDGTPVPTPVWFGVAEGRLYFRSESAVGKIKRVRNDPHVRVAPCSVRGKPLGPTTEARARVLGPEDAERAEAAVASNYGAARRAYEGAGERMGVDTVYVEVTPAARSAG